MDHLDQPPFPEELQRQTQIASVPLYLRTLFARLPSDMTVELGLVSGVTPTLPLAARQLLKLGLFSEQISVRTRAVAVPGEQGVCVLRSGRRFTPTAGDLDAGISHLTRAMLEALLSPAEFSLLTESFAFQTSTLATLRTLTTFMLEADDVDQALFIMLSGLTSGYALGFNRAVLFTLDESGQRLDGAKAIGPIDEAEAHRVWEAVELEDKSLEDLIADLAHRNFDTRFQQAIQRLSLREEGAPRFFERLRQARAPFVLSREALLDLVGRPFDIAEETIVATLRPHGRLLGVVMADNRYNGAPISQDQRDYFSLFTDQTALAWENLALLKRVEALAREDALTGVLSRRELESRMAIEFARCRRHGRPCALVILDIDLFKQVNDTRGHAAGDEMLRTLGAILTRELRADDIVGRFGGDEFVVVMPEIGEAQACQVARRLGRRAREHGISLSMGGACWPQHVAQPEDLFERADQRLYEVKRQGRSGIAFAEAAMCGFSDEG